MHDIVDSLSTDWISLIGTEGERLHWLRVMKLWSKEYTSKGGDASKHSFKVFMKLSLGIKTVDNFASMH